MVSSPVRRANAGISGFANPETTPTYFHHIPDGTIVAVMGSPAASLSTMSSVSLTDPPPAPMSTVFVWGVIVTGSTSPTIVSVSGVRPSE